jgi:phosphoenolpyruvate carboxykinase (GTP)
MRVLRWVYHRVQGDAPDQSRDTAIGILPTPDAIGAPELGLSPRQAEALLTVDRDSWLSETKESARFLEHIGDRVPPEVYEEHRALVERLQRPSR